MDSVSGMIALQIKEIFGATSLQIKAIFFLISTNRMQPNVTSPQYM